LRLGTDISSSNDDEVPEVVDEFDVVMDPSWQDDGDDDASEESD